MNKLPENYGYDIVAEGLYPDNTKDGAPEVSMPKFGYRESLESLQASMVRQPGHYKIFPDTEVIDLIRKCLTEEEFKGFCKGNILKYRLRDKENLDEDFAKSKEYKGYLQDIDSI